MAYRPESSFVPSLAMCRQCVDITADLQHNCTDQSHYCTYSLLNGATLTGPKPGTSMYDLADAPLTIFNVSATAADVYSRQRLSNGQKGKIYDGHFTAIQTEIKEKNPGDGLAAMQCDGGRIPSEILDQKAVLLCDEGRGWSLSAGHR